MFHCALHYRDEHRKAYGPFVKPIFEIDFFKVQGVQKYFLHTIFADNSCLKNQTVVEHTLFILWGLAFEPDLF